MDLPEALFEDKNCIKINSTRLPSIYNKMSNIVLKKAGKLWNTSSAPAPGS